MNHFLSLYAKKKKKKILTQNVVFYKNKKDKDLFFSSFISFED